MNVIQRMWKDQVGSNVIAGIILLAIGAAWAFLSGLRWNHPVSIPLWLVVIWGALSAFAALYIVRAALDRRKINEPPQLARRSKENKIVIERLSNELKIRFKFTSGPDYAVRSGHFVWQETYLAMFRLLGPKLMAGAEEAEVKRYLDHTLKEEFSGKYDSLYVFDTDFQSMKVKLQDLGLVNLTPTQGKMHWALTAGAHEMLPKLRYGIGK